MSTQVTITLPDEVCQRAERFAHLANRDVASVLADSILLSIPPVREEVLTLSPVDKPGYRQGGTHQELLLSRPSTGKHYDYR
jgi:hypothetical protein